MPNITDIQADESREAVEAVAKSFARHETFHVRYGWLKKGFDASFSDPGCFTRRDTALRLGVGKNMSRAIRYWCRAFKLVEERPHPERPSTLISHPTEFGKQLIGPSGWDPYLESLASLWLLHWVLLQPTCYAPTWYAALNGSYGSVFDDEELVYEVDKLRESRPLWGEISRSSINKDITCFIRMYCVPEGQSGSLEDTLDSPFSALGLIRAAEGGRRMYSFVNGPKDGLSSEVLVYAMLDFLRSTGGGVTTMLFSRLASETMSPGRIFRVGQSDLLRATSDCAERVSGISVVDVAGRFQFTVSRPFADLQRELLQSLFADGGGNA